MYLIFYLNTQQSTVSELRRTRFLNWAYRDTVLYAKSRKDKITESSYELYAGFTEALGFYIINFNLPLLKKTTPLSQFSVRTVAHVFFLYQPPDPSFHQAQQVSAVQFLFTQSNKKSAVFNHNHSEFHRNHTLLNILMSYLPGTEF